jgi:hypothetical protein
MVLAETAFKVLAYTSSISRTIALTDVFNRAILRQNK